jgi:uncharacterized protein (DUF302 family)
VKRVLACMMLLLGLNLTARADELMMARVTRPFPEAMNTLQDAIREHGYTVSRVQRVDVGLNASGFQTAEYRVVFFGKADEIHNLSGRFPELIPYLPLNIVIFAEGDDTLILSANPNKLADFFDRPALRAQFGRWAKDMRAIFDDVTRNP